MFAGLVEVVSKRKYKFARWSSWLTNSCLVYANTMLAMLNARQTMRNKSDVIDTVELSGQRRTHGRNSLVGGQLVSQAPAPLTDCGV